ncbi:MAG: metallophosphoesterase family protein [Candidatus Promineifilaceae bacterium]|jgi:Icc protein
MTAESVYFVHISDTHIGTSKDFTRHGHATLPCAERVVELINTMPIQPHFVVHTGDVVADPQPRAYQQAATVFADLGVPIYYVNGNHDTAAYIRKYLPMGSSDPAGEDPNRLSYTFEVAGYRFLVLDARGPDEIDPQGFLPESQLELTAQEAASEGPPLTIFLHYPVLPLNSIWMDNNMLIQNGDALHQVLLPAHRRIRGVFLGHVHQNMQTTKDGITYYSTASIFAQFNAWPNDEDVRYDPAHPPGYGFVHLLPDRTIVHQHTFPRP